MLLLIDENVPRSVATVFQTHGHDIVFVKEALGEGTPDPAVVTYADTINAIIVTWNHKHFKRWVSRATQGRRQAGRISFKCEELIEAEYALAQSRKDKRVLIELTLHTAEAVGFLVRRPLHRCPEVLMSDTISPSVTSRVSRGRDAVGRHGGSRRSDHHQHYTIRGRRFVSADKADTSSIPRLKPWVLRRFL